MTLEELKNLDSPVPQNTDQLGSNATNVIVQHPADGTATQIALERAYADIEYWKKKAEEGDGWKERAIMAEARVAVLSGTGTAQGAMS